MAADWELPGDGPTGGTWGVTKGQPGEMIEWQKEAHQWNPNRAQAQYRNWMPAYYPQGVTNWTQGPAKGGQDPWDMGAGAAGWTQHMAGGQTPGVGPGWMASDEAQRRQQSGNEGGSKPDANKVTSQGWIGREEESPSITETPHAAAQKIASMLEKTMANQEHILQQRHGKGHEEESMRAQNWDEHRQMQTAPGNWESLQPGQGKKNLGGNQQ